MKTQHKLIAYEGRYIIMPPHKEGQLGWNNLAQPNVHSPGGDAAALYPINTKFVDFDRTFIYGYDSVHDAAAKANVGMFNNSQKETVTWGAIAGVIGDTLIALDETSFDVETSAAVDVFAGGYLMPRTNPYSSYRIVGNTAYNLGRETDEIDITIEDDGLTAAVDAGVATCWLDKNPYAALGLSWAAGRSYVTFMGVVIVLPVVSTFNWYQTWGPCHVVPENNEPGGAASSRDCVFHIDGSISLPAGGSEQRAGFVLPNSTSGNTFSWFIMLQLER